MFQGPPVVGISLRFKDIDHRERGQVILEARMVLYEYLWLCLDRD